jgi:hypothetical protein
LKQQNFIDQSIERNYTCVVVFEEKQEKKKRITQVFMYHDDNVFVVDVVVV